MTIGLLSLFALTGSLVLFKLGIMVLAVFLLTRTLLPTSKTSASPPAAAPTLARGGAPR